MDPELTQRLRTLLETQRLGSLGTLHKGEPYVSMVPFALLPGGSGFVIHVSEAKATEALRKAQEAMAKSQDKQELATVEGELSMLAAQLAAIRKLRKK